MQAQSHAKRVFTILLVLTAVIMGSAERTRGQLLGSGFLDGKLYDINPTTGAATNPRNLGIGWALAFSPTGILYGVTQPGGTPTGNALYVVNPVNGMATMISTFNLGSGIGVEGDIAFDPISGILYGVSGGGSLFTINTSNGLLTPVGNVPGAQDLSAMAFDTSGNLYLVDTATGKLLRVDKNTAGVISSVSLSPAPGGGVAGLSFNPCSGVAYFASGSGSFTTDNLYTVNTTSGAMTLVGHLSGATDGVANLAQPPGAADLYMKDTMAPDLPEDFGVEPSVSQLLYISRDIWVRTSQDTTTGTSANPGPDTTLLTDMYYANEHQHQNPTYNATTPSYVYVKVRNRGCGSSAGTEKLRVYWANASTGLPWPGSSGLWNELDCVAGGGTQPCSLPVIAAGQDYVVEIPWLTPNPASFGGSDHFCLVARIETQSTYPYGMTSPEVPGQWLWQNVAGNNNIVWKNVTVFAGAGHGQVIIRNTFDRVTPVTLHFAVPARELKDNLLLHADIFVDLGDALMRKWRQGGQRPQGFEVVGRTTIKITDPTNAVLGGLSFAPGEKQTIDVRMQLKPGDKARVGREFVWDVIQMAPPLSEVAKPSAIGGERYILAVPKAAQGGGVRNP